VLAEYGEATVPNRSIAIRHDHPGGIRAVPSVARQMPGGLHHAQLEPCRRVKIAA
jgi:hypothetical protein